MFSSGLIECSCAIIGAMMGGTVPVEYFWLILSLVCVVCIVCLYIYQGFKLVRFYKKHGKVCWVDNDAPEVHDEVEDPLFYFLSKIRWLPFAPKHREKGSFEAPEVQHDTAPSVHTSLCAHLSLCVHTSLSVHTLFLSVHTLSVCTLFTPSFLFTQEDAAEPGSTERALQRLVLCRFHLFGRGRIKAGKDREPARPGDYTYYLLLTTDYLLLAIYHSLLTTHYYVERNKNPSGRER